MHDLPTVTPYDPLTTFFTHNLWANSVLFDLCAGLSDDQLDSDIAGTYGTIRATLAHIASAERSYVHRILTGERLPPSAPPRRRWRSFRRRFAPAARR